MIVHVGQHALVDPAIPKGNAGQIAAALANGQQLAGTRFTLKADGTVLPPTASIPTGTNVLEVIEATDGPAPAAHPAPEPDDA